MELDLKGLIPRKLHPVERRRIRDGKRALFLPEPKTIHGMNGQIDILLDGARALQSLDDLGTPEANARAWKAMEWLMVKADRLREQVAHQIVKR
jgi:hypothetical protein